MPRPSPASPEDEAHYMELRQIWRANPVLYARDRLGLNPTTQQAEMLTAMAEPEARVTVRSGHGTGKSSGTSALIWWALECLDYPRIPCTAPTRSQLAMVLWGELSKWRRKSDERCRAEGFPEALLLSNLFEFVSDRIYAADSPNDWFAVARTARKENPEALQGFGTTELVISEDGQSIAEELGDGNFMFIMEEASGIPEPIYEVVQGALARRGARALMIGNPTKNVGFFARSHTRDRSSYTRVLHFKSSDSPLVDPSYRAKLVRQYGEGSNVVRVRADGEFPKQDDDVLISLEIAEAPIHRDVYERETGKRRLGIDPARFGDDRTVLVVRHGRNVEHIEVHAKTEHYETAGYAMNLIDRFKIDEVYCEVNGLGSGVVSHLAQNKRKGELSADLYAVNVSEAAPVEVLNREKDEAQPYRIRDHIWLQMRKWLRDEEPSYGAVEKLLAEDLAGELCTLRYGFDSSGRLIMESKDDMKRRLGSEGRSPDLADALAMTFAPPTVAKVSTIKIKGF